MSLSFPASPALNQVYQGWKWNGAAWDPNYAANFVTSISGQSGALSAAQAVGPGNRVLIQSQVLPAGSSVAAVNFFYNFDNTYDLYDLEIYDLQVSAADLTVGLRCSFDGSTWITSATGYYYAQIYALSNAAGANTGGQAAYIPVSTLAQNALVHAVVEFALPWTTDRAKYFIVRSVGNPTSGVQRIAGCGLVGGVLTPLKGVQVGIVSGAGNMTRGVFNLYGIVKAGAGGS